MTSPQDYPKNSTELAWGMLIELRKEIIEVQKLRSQTTGLKVSFVSAFVAIIIANLDEFTAQLLVFPALASIMFDVLIFFHRRSIKKIGRYIASTLEPQIRQGIKWKHGEYSLWEEYLISNSFDSGPAITAEFGLTAVTVVIAIYSLFFPTQFQLSIPASLLLLILLAFDYRFQINS